MNSSQNMKIKLYNGVEKKSKNFSCTVTVEQCTVLITVKSIKLYGPAQFQGHGEFCGHGRHTIRRTMVWLCVISVQHGATVHVQELLVFFDTTNSKFFCCIPQPCVSQGPNHTNGCVVSRPARRCALIVISANVYFIECLQQILLGMNGKNNREATLGALPTKSTQSNQ